MDAVSNKMKDQPKLMASKFGTSRKKFNQIFIVNKQIALNRTLQI